MRSKTHFRSAQFLLAWFLPIASSAPALAQNAWFDRTPPTSPPGMRVGHALAYDSARGRVVLFGGHDGSSANVAETWEWDGSSWTRRTPAIRPPARQWHAMAFDSARGRVVLFGGRTDSGTYLGDTWEWDGSSWLQRTLPTSPSPRLGHAMAFDSARGRVVLFGGHAASGISADTWEWDGSSWIQRTSFSSPPARARSAMVYDVARGRMVLFGGYSSGDVGRPLGLRADTWSWDGTWWEGYGLPTSPPARNAHAMAYDSARGRVVLFGGDGGGSGKLSDTWEWVGSAWIERVSARSPFAREGHAMAYHAGRGRTVLFGGNSRGYLDAGTWEWDGAGWLGGPASPPPRGGHAMAYDASGRVMVFGGFIDSTTLSDTWQWNGSSWLERALATAPPARLGHAMAFDSARGRVVLFGGRTDLGTSFGDTWEWNGNSWLQRASATSPPARSHHGMAYDSARGRVVLFGGVVGSGPLTVILADTWEWDGTTWHERTLPSSPTPRYDHAMAYDSNRRRVVLFGGWTSSGRVVYDTCEWDGCSWVERSTSPRPPARQAHAMAYDSARGRTVVFGGYGYDYLDDTWEWDGSQWSDTSPTTSPFFRLDHAMAYHSTRGVVVLFGDPWLLGDTWEYGACAGIELCNGVDDDCDEVVPPGEADADADGVRICGGDCDDAQSEVFPGAPEICDGRNNDCLDAAWPALPTEEFDDDHDGVNECEGDCDDGNPLIHPSGSEVCNALDDDCDALVDEAGDVEDGDSDGAPELCDNCATVPNPTQGDEDGDLLGDACDNCPIAANADQADGDGELVWQWASAATASSEYSAGNYSAMQAAGSPENAGVCEERPTNWSPLGSTAAPEWLELSYSVPLQAIGVDVHESFEQGFVRQIELRQTSGAYHMVWSATDTTTCGDVLEARFGLTGYTVDRVRVHTSVPGWEEIDAVALVGPFDASEGVGNACDNCPEHANPSQADFDGDGAGDVCDCALTDPAARPAAEVEGLVVGSPGGGVARLSWQPAAGAASYEIVRGALSSLSVTHMGECHASGITALIWDDPEVPLPGQALVYLVRGKSAACGPGTLGFGIYGLPRAQTGSNCQE
jgi:hypothetical protein